MNLKDIHNVYFVGIGGIGMSALARYFAHIHKKVAGYDKTPTPLTAELEAMGMDIHYTDSMDQVPKAFLDPQNTLIVYTPAVPVDHSEYRYFLENGFTLKKRSEVLGLITQDTFCLAVAGTHGKTTTSCLLAHMFEEGKMPFSAFLGGISENLNSNFLFRGNTYSVTEADEFDRSFLRLSPTVACITSMDADHLDIYGNADMLEKAFEEFAARVKPGGKLLVRKGLPLPGITYALEEEADYHMENIRVAEGQYRFDIHTPQGVFPDLSYGKPGRHNLLNALAAFGMALEAGVDPKDLARALDTFKGVARRFSYRINQPDLVFIDDYAHHPTEIDAVCQAVSEMHPHKRNLAVFQPHLYTRTRDFAEAFARSLSAFDSVLLLDIYPAREVPIEGITSEWLLEKIDNPNKKLISKSELIAAIRKQNPEVLIAMGAGDIGLEVPKIQKELENAL